jgi:hypothetical protein
LRVEEAEELPGTGSIGRLAFVVHVRSSGGRKGEGIQREAGIYQEGTRWKASTNALEGATGEGRTGRSMEDIQNRTKVSAYFR